MFWVASVIRNGGTENWVTITPWTMPTAAPRNSPPRTPTATAPSVNPWSTIQVTVKAPAAAATAPTDKSIPPRRIGKIVPQTIIPYTEMDKRMLFIFAPVKNTPGWSSVRTSMTAARIHILWDFPSIFLMSGFLSICPALLCNSSRFTLRGAAFCPTCKDS